MPTTEPVGRRRLTGAAKVVLRHAEEIFGNTDRLHRASPSAGGGVRGEVSVSGFGTTLAPLILSAAAILKQRLPELRTTLAELDPPTSFELLQLGRTDAVIAVESPLTPAPDARFDKRPLMTEVFDVTVHEDHPLAQAPSLTLRDLADETWIFAAVGMCQEIPLVACTAAGFTPQATHVIGDWNATFAAVRQDLGICLMPRLARRSSEPASRCGVSTTRPGAGCSPPYGPAVGTCRRSRRYWRPWVRRLRRPNQSSTGRRGVNFVGDRRRTAEASNVSGGLHIDRKDHCWTAGGGASDALGAVRRSAFAPLRLPPSFLLSAEGEGPS
ncbi:LysR substrate-binding domain-containing protein [Streptomyces griseofuscus]|uniref:LysR substrate-binding domain-containing protein n=1 Tax=Streptomyces griseofuscus TaxID=146922 RepID=UPI0036B128DF